LSMKYNYSVSKYKPHLVILYGGPSSEREVSFGTRDFFTELYKEQNPVTIEWGEDGYFYTEGLRLSENEFLDYLSNTRSAVIIASHGEFVEDGYIQERFESFSIPYTGSDSVSCRLCMNKTKSQETVKGIVTTIPTYSGYSQLIYPFIAKPNNLGSSVGIYLITNSKELEEYLTSVKIDNYIFQPFIKGIEMSLGAVRENNTFMNLYPTEIIPNSPFFDYKSKYQQGGSQEYTPARISKDLTDKMMKTNNDVHNKLGLGYYSRSDYILAEDGVLYYLETNALPGMTSTSLVPQQLRYSHKVESFRDGLISNLILA